MAQRERVEAAEGLTRREFVRVGAASAAVVAAGGVAGCAPKAATSDVDTPVFRFEGRGEMQKRILVGYATRTGSTVGVAEAIGRSLGERGFAVDVKPLRERPALAAYDAVVLGSAVNGGQWLDEAVGFVKANSAALGSLPVAAFCVHAMNAGSDSKATERRLAYLDRVRAAIKLTDEGFFLGKGPVAEDASLIARWAFKAFGGAGEGDLRDWDAIDAWAEEVAL